MHKLGLDFFLFTTKLYLNDTNANSVNLKSQSLRIDKKTTNKQIQSRVSLRFKYQVAALYLNLSFKYPHCNNFLFVPLISTSLLFFSNWHLIVPIY